MSQWNSGPYPQDPNTAYYAGQPGYPPQQPGAYPPPGGYPSAPPPSGYPGAGGYPPAPGFQPPPYASVDPYNADAYGGANYTDDLEVKGFDFNDANIRRGFVRKVYSILCVQLLITVAFIAWFIYDENTKYYVQQHSELFLIALIVAFVSLIALACCGELRRKTPMNFIFLILFTLAEAFLLAVSSSAYDTDAVLMAAGITAAVCLGLTLFAFQTKWDFTMMGGILCVGVIILLIFSFVAIFVRSNIFHLIFASLGAFIFSVYLVYDTQLMMGGKHKYSISPEEYIFAALNLYTDIINIFLYILRIIQSVRDSN